MGVPVMAEQGGGHDVQQEENWEMDVEALTGTAAM